MSVLKKIFALLLLSTLSMQVFAQDMVDDSIDSDIKAKYNTKKIEEDLLPELPKDLPVWDDTVFSPSTQPSVVLPSKDVTVEKKNSQISAGNSSSKSSVVLNSGKKFRVKLQNAVSDRSPVGTKLTFVSQYPETFRYVTIPAGTIFKGKVTDSHPPYLSGNGGLIVIEVNEIVYQGVAYDIDAKISVADGKKIFFNNIKGKRKFLQNMWNSTSFGSQFLKKMWRKTCSSLNKGGLDIIVAPFSFSLGVVVYAANVVASPALALFSKGGAISIPANSRFVIQLENDALILK